MWITEKIVSILRKVVERPVLFVSPPLSAVNKPSPSSSSPPSSRISRSLVVFVRGILMGRRGQSSSAHVLDAHNTHVTPGSTMAIIIFIHSPLAAQLLPLSRKTWQ
jgi:hypothetical protein